MHILIANFSQMVTDRTNIAIANKYKVVTAFPLAYLHFTLTRSKGHGQGHVQFHCQYLANGDRYGKHCISQQIESLMWALDYRI